MDYLFELIKINYIPLCVRSFESLMPGKGGGGWAANVCLWDGYSVSCGGPARGASCTIWNHFSSFVVLFF